MSFHLRSQVDGPKGYSLDMKLSGLELELVRNQVRESWLQRMARVNPNVAKQAENISMDEYHTIADQLDHGRVWPQTERMLSTPAIQKIRDTEFFSTLAQEFGPIVISDELSLGFEEVYWRIVRPGIPEDFGPLHADKWFWDVRGFKIPEGMRRVKVWIALHTEPGKNGLRLGPGTHLRDWKFEAHYKHGSMKPQILDDESAMNIQLQHTQAGDAVVFHDKLIHGGAMNHGEKTRVSVEFTMIVADK